MLPMQHLNILPALMVKSVITMQMAYPVITDMLNSQISPDKFKKIEKELKRYKKKLNSEVKARKAAEKEK